MTVLNWTLPGSVSYNMMLFLSIMILGLNGCIKGPPIKQGTGVDFTQAEMMLDFLKGIADGEPVSYKIDPILKTEGTELIIKQMNFVRRVSFEQYGQLLNGLADGQLPHISPLDSSERSKRGVEGLTKRMWQSLSWAVEHTDIVKEQVAILQNMNVYQDALDLALTNLPEPVEISPSLFIVIGGRAGAAALDGNRIYIDILIMTYSRISQNRPFMKESEFIEFFAHEMHHIGLAKYHQTKFGSLSLGKDQNRMFQMLSSIVAEGSASYLINGHRDETLMRKNLKLPADKTKENELLCTFEELLNKMQNGEIQTQEEYDKFNTLMIGQGYHIVGSVMLWTIDRAEGMNSVMKVISDPRLLIPVYNKAAQSISVKSDADKIYIFNPDLIQKISLL